MKQESGGNKQAVVSSIRWHEESGCSKQGVAAIQLGLPANGSSMITDAVTKWLKQASGGRSQAVAAFKQV